MYPNFLCIGAPKAGTTWLFDNLKRHPEVWLPKYKSIQYHSGLAEIARRKKFKRLFFKHLFEDISLKQLRWDVNYFFSTKLNDDWYQSLFEPGRNKKAVGEIAPSYSALSCDTIETVYSKMPDSKIIYFLRNPVDRMWSHALLSLVSNRSREIDSIKDEEFFRFFANIDQQKRTDYIQTYQNWNKYYPSKQIFVRFFEDIKHDPDKLLRDICDFLEIDNSLGVFSISKDRNIFKGPNHKIPQQYESILYKRYYHQILEVNKLFGSYSDNWLERANNYNF